MPQNHWFWHISLNGGAHLKNPSETFQTNVEGTKNVLIASKENKIKKIIASSSAAVYGESEVDVKLTEKSKIKPISPYGESKSRMEKEIMEFLSPNGPVYQAGTLSGNPLAMMAGYTTLSILNRDPSIYESLANKTNYLHEGYVKILSDTEIPYTINRLGSMISLHFTDQSVVDFETSSKGDNEMFRKYFHGMLKRGVYLPPSPYESYFLNDAISYSDLDYTLGALESFIKEDL